MKLLLLLIVVAVVYWTFKSYKRKVERRGEPPAAGTAEDMVRCAQCGVHLPRSESLLAGQSFYCSAEHRRLREHAD